MSGDPRARWMYENRHRHELRAIRAAMVARMWRNGAAIARAGIVWPIGVRSW